MKKSYSQMRESTQVLIVNEKQKKLTLEKY